MRSTAPQNVISDNNFLLLMNGEIWLVLDVINRHS